MPDEKRQSCISTIERWGNLKVMKEQAYGGTNHRGTGGENGCRLVEKGIQRNSASRRRGRRWATSYNQGREQAFPE